MCRLPLLVCLVVLPTNGFVVSSRSSTTPLKTTARGYPRMQTVADKPATVADAITPEAPLRVVIAGAGVGGLALANALKGNPKVDVSVIEKTSEFKRFGGPIQLASNAMEVFRSMDGEMYSEIESQFTWTGNKTNGIKDGIRDEWYSKFDLKTPAENRDMPFTGVIERPDLQQILLDRLDSNVVQNGFGITNYKRHEQGVQIELDNGEVVEGDVLIGADGIWSAVRATMRNEPVKGEGSGVTYSGYTVFAGELNYDSPDVGVVGYKVYIGPGQYFVITDIGKGRYQWYAFLSRPAGSSEAENRPEGSVKYLENIFTGWSPDIHAILTATQEHEIEQRDLYDRPPSVNQPWCDGPVALLGDAVHAMMPNLGQGGCQAIEDAMVIAEELGDLESRAQVTDGLKRYRDRRLVRSAAVQGLSRFASDIIIRGFDTPAKVVMSPAFRMENFNYAGIVTKLLQPILPVFFTIQFAFLYDGWQNKFAFDLKAAVGFLLVGGAILLISAGLAEEFTAGLLLSGSTLLDFVAGGEIWEGLLSVLVR